MPLTAQQIDEQIIPFYQELAATGIPMDLGELTQSLAALQAESTLILSEIHKVIGFYPNPASNEHWAKAMEKLGITNVPKNTRGGPKTDEHTLRRYIDRYPLLEKLQTARKLKMSIATLQKLKGALEARILHSGRSTVHPTYYIGEEVSRVHSGGEANPMNWPKETRKLVSQFGYWVGEADYSSLELMVLAVLSGDTRLLEELKEGNHFEKVGATFFGVETLTYDQRQTAKVGVYASLYEGPPAVVSAAVNQARREDAKAKGLDPRRIERFSQRDAEEFQQKWRDRYPQAESFRQKLARATTFAVSYHGRKMPLDRGSEEYRIRLAINSPIQNTAADLAKQGFLNVHHSENLRSLGLKVFTTRHDSIAFLLPQKADRDLVEMYLKEEMEKVDPEFPLRVRVKFGPNWGSL